MKLIIVNSYIVKVDANQLKGVVKYKYFEQIIPDEFKILKQQMSYLSLEKFEFELEGHDINHSKVKQNRQSHDKLDQILQVECLRYFDRLEKVPSQNIEINQDTIESDPDIITTLAEKVWNNQL